MARPLSELPADLRARLVAGPLLIVSKTNALSPVHRRARMDDISVKKIGPDGQPLQKRVAAEALPYFGHFSSVSIQRPRV